MKSSHGCWTCRLRRKKCDGKKPRCDICVTLDITCHFQLESKPEWMDGGLKQTEMAEQVKREIKIKARQRRGEPTFQIWSEFRITPPNLPIFSTNPIPGALEISLENNTESTGSFSEAPIFRHQQGLQTEQTSQHAQESRAFEGSDAVLSLFYLENVLPFLFPFYNPSLLQGGKAWILDMIMKRPVVRQAILCQSYYFSLSCEATADDAHWDEVLRQAKSAYLMLRGALQTMNDPELERSLGCTVRVMASIMQVHRFEITILSFDNWQTHLHAVASLLKQLLDCNSSFNAIKDNLGPSITLPVQNARLPNAEQAAFRFSSTLVIFDDIIASTTLQKQPRLYKYHRALLCSDIEGADPALDVESVFGVKNWTLLQIGEIASLDAWKLECKNAGNLDIMELVYRATTIKQALSNHLTALQQELRSEIISSLLDLPISSHHHSSHGPLIARIWAHAALLYLFIVTSGWQPANDDVRYHVKQIVEILNCQIFTPALLRTVVWPVCVAGCLAESAQEAQFCKIIQGLKPTNLFGNIFKAFEIMENVWRNRTTGDLATRDLASCFRSQEDPVLLV